MFNAHATFAGGDDDARIAVGYFVNPNLKFSVANTSYSDERAITPASLSPERDGIALAINSARFRNVNV